MTIYRAEFTEYVNKCYDCGRKYRKLHATAWYSSLELAEQQLPVLKELRDKLEYDAKENEEVFWCNDDWDATPVSIVSMEVHDCIQSKLIVELH